MLLIPDAQHRYVVGGVHGGVKAGHDHTSSGIVECPLFSENKPLC